MGRNYTKLPIETFGRHLLRSGDLDPVYIALQRLRKNGDWPEDYLFRWLIAYWCFYNAGIACYLAEREGFDFWRAMMIAAMNADPTPWGGRWPRGHERRHFRAKIAIDGVIDLHNKYGGRPEDMIDMITQRAEIRGGELCVDPLGFRVVSARAQEHKGFGPWIGFKVADMVDRCLGIPVSFANADVFMFDDPTEAALKLWRAKTRTPETARPKDKDSVIKGVVAYLIDEFKEFNAPPIDDRPVNVQEIETILCKWKSHMNGHYPLNNDINEIVSGVAPWVPHCQRAWEFNACMPQPLEGV